VNSAIIPVATYVATAQSDKLSQAIRFGGCISDTRVANDYYRIVTSPSGPLLLWGGGMSTQASVPAGLAETMQRAILSVYPQLDDIRISNAWAGIMGYAVHKMPIICKADEGIYIATAFGGRGLNTTAMAAQLVCEAICDGSNRYRAFAPFGMRNAHGVAGRVAAQIEYWRSSIADRVAEARARA
jgi:gamma-glutamylputrescine oxidase